MAPLVVQVVVMRFSKHVIPPFTEAKWVHWATEEQAYMQSSRVATSKESQVGSGV